ncbi:hypothetical protein CEE37_00900 [candidate division LCP-89 bacterium B3_LCP]|uniref:Uncharacterized protein n=1 Tax=candidate division LCP-89 bacterium B3_LCP TaxID=2012998 RepID=A0A532V518_UNCL8|nr:MAG: hypothetical protein CEE37_00900 [candidate division LCP-89 bacterium B3_LCP]
MYVAELVNQGKKMHQEFIDIIRNKLSELGAINVDSYIRKLEDNRNDNLQFDDLKCEDYAALLFLHHGFSVEMRDSPDLRLFLDNNEFYAEVKHFRFKDQDRIDQEKMEAIKGMLTNIGETKKDPWDQIVDTAIEKVNQFIDGKPNILVIASSSPHCIDDSIVQTAINKVEELTTEQKYPGIEKLNGVLFLSTDFNISQRRDVYFYRIESAVIPISTIVLERFNQINGWHFLVKTYFGL